MGLNFTLVRRQAVRDCFVLRRFAEMKKPILRTEDQKLAAFGDSIV
jgi:hypothetical protein